MTIPVYHRIFLKPISKNFPYKSGRVGLGLAVSSPGVAASAARPELEVPGFPAS